MARSKAVQSSESTQMTESASRPATGATARREGSESLRTPAIPSSFSSSTEQVASGDKLPRVQWSLPSLKVLGAVELKRLKDQIIEGNAFCHDKLEKIGVKGIGDAYRAAHPPIVHSGSRSRASATELAAASIAPATLPQEAAGSAKHSSRGTKRKAEADAKDEAENVDLAGSFKKVYKHGINAFTTIPEVVQLAMYGTQLLCAGPMAHRAISLLVQDQVVRVWIYDRQGAIQCEGFDIVKNLDYFAVLLFALQRFRASDWGHLDQFSYDDRPASGLPGWILTLPARDNAQKQLSLRLDAKEIGREPSGIAGRFTRAFYVKCKDFEDDPIMVKLSSIGAGRDDEAGFVQQAVAVAENQKDHLPDLVGFHRFEETRTGDLRMALGIQGKNAESGARVLWALAFKRLEPICRLQGKQLLIAFRDCLKCHHDLYKKGILHRDISTGNLMYRLKKTAEGLVVCGVLNDFDLAKYRNRAPKPSGMERTGTLPYMALDLLKAPDGLIEHLYRHDLESCIWVFVDLATSYLNGQERIDPPLQKWFSVYTYSEMYEKKLAFITDSTWDEVMEAASENGLAVVLDELLSKLETVILDITRWRKSQKRRRPALQDTKGNNLSGLSQSDSTAQASNPTEPQGPYSSEAAVDELYDEFLAIVQKAIDTWQEPGMTPTSPE